MADDISASIHQLHQPRPRTAAERAKAYRARKRASANAEGLTLPAVVPEASCAVPAHDVPPATPVSSMVMENRVQPGSTVTFGPVRERDAAPILLILAAFALAIVGMTMNGWFARSLGSSDVAGWLFLAIGVCADLVALVMPSVAARRWRLGNFTSAAAGWLVWSMTFALALMSGVGFGAVNIADITAARGERVTASVAAARDGLADAVAARDRECKGGTGKFCRERESTVVDRRAVLEREMATVTREADPQTEGARRLVAWASRGALAPSADDFAMVRLLLLSLLPQVGGILLMIGRKA